jgi:hypothetical protein
MALATDDARLPSLFAHTTCKDWGIGVLAWELAGKRGYLFEDGTERTMASGFHDLMRKVEQPSPDQMAASVRLQRMLVARARAHSSIPGASGPTFADQLATFHEIYPAGLLDPKWEKDVRGEGAEQRAPQHRSALVQEAQEQLSVAVLDSLISSQQYEQIWNLVVTVLGHRDLVPTAQLKKSKSASSERQRDLALAVRELLYGKSPYEKRFDRYVAALGAHSGEPTRWEIATALAAAVHPTEHVCVQPLVFRALLKASGSRETTAARPSSASYMRLLAITRVIAKKLGEKNEVPRDLLDVLDFIRTAHKPATKVRVTSAKASKKSVVPAAADDDHDHQDD